MTRELTNIERATRAWGKDMPRYIRLLATEADKHGQRGAGRLIDRTSSNVSRILNRKYNASYDEIEKVVLSKLGADKVLCPIWGNQIPLSSCIRNRRRTGTPDNFLKHQFAENCPVCPNNTDIDQED
jgi:hypothetical protein